jgi:hypothetical protein
MKPYPRFLLMFFDKDFNVWKLHAGFLTLKDAQVAADYFEPTTSWFIVDVSEGLVLEKIVRSE